MKNPIRFVFGFSPIVLIAAVLMMGCEVTSKSGGVKINPSGATLRKGESITLVASGGNGYFWNLSDRTLGVLSATHGDRVVYTSLKGPSGDDPVVQTVTVVADVFENGTTNSAVLERSAIAYITHVSGNITVSPASVTLKQGQSATFSARGGDTYAWVLESPAWGILSKETGNSVRYTSQYNPPDGKAVVQRITITAGNGGIAEAFVTQAPGSLIQIYPLTTTLRNGEDQIYSLSGGSAYQMSSSQPTWGFFTVLDYNTIRWTSTRITPANSTEAMTITVTDIDSGKATATVYNIP